MSYENSDDKWRSSVWNYVLSHRAGVHVWVKYTGWSQFEFNSLHVVQETNKMKMKLRSPKLRDNLKW